MIEKSYKCDVCTAQRGPENHWLLVQAVQLGYHEDSSVVEGPSFLPWNDTLAKQDVQHICGAACAHKVLDRYLESLREGK